MLFTVTSTNWFTPPSHPWFSWTRDFYSYSWKRVRAWLCLFYIFVYLWKKHCYFYFYFLLYIKQLFLIDSRVIEMNQKEEIPTENHTTTMVSVIFTIPINKENSSLFMNSIFWENKNKGRNLKSEKSKHYSHKPQRNYTFMNSVSGQLTYFGFYEKKPFTVSWCYIQWLSPPCLFKNIFPTKCFYF